MQISELRQLARQVFDRVGELDHEQYDAVNHRNTRMHSDLYRQACEELVSDPEWREPIRIMVEGWCYYSGADEFLAA
jgi:hypothetical protein